MNPPEVSREYSSVWANAPAYARSMLDSPQAWSAGQPEKGQWMQIDLGNTSCVSGVVTQGRAATNNYQRVTFYKIVHSVDNKTFTELPFIFSANLNPNSHADTKVVNRFGPVQARFVRVVVQEWNNYPSMRAGVIAGDLGIL